MANSTKAMRIIMAVVALAFVISWIIKFQTGQAGDDWINFRQGFLVTLAAFLTLSIFSFLYGDNPLYRFSEHLFVGISAAYWMCYGFWSTIVGNVIPRTSETLSAWFEVPFKSFSPHYFVPVFLGVILLLRLFPKLSWVSRWPLAFIIGTTAGLNLPRYLQSDFIQQMNNTFIPLLPDWQGFGHFFSSFSFSMESQLIAILTNVVIFIGVLCGLIYFFFSKEHKGAFGAASRVGIWILMVTFGASFGYTVMGRISLLVGRISFLFHDWLNIL